MAIEELLNRIGPGNRFIRAIVVGNSREFSDGDKEEQEISEPRYPNGCFGVPASRFWATGMGAQQR
jgi:hypothetical protein